MKKNKQRWQHPPDKGIDVVIEQLKNKCPGQNKISAESIKYGGEEMKQSIYEIIVELWRNETMPKKWGQVTSYLL